MLLTAADAGARRSGPIVFVVVVVGGLGSLAGALIASMLIGILQTFAVAVDYSLLDLLRTLGIAGRARIAVPRAAVDQARHGGADRPLSAAGADADRAAARACSARATYERAWLRRACGGTRRCRGRGRAAALPWPRRRAAGVAHLHRRVARRAAVTCRASTPIRALAADADGDRGGVRAVVQPAASDRRACCRSATLSISALAAMRPFTLCARSTRACRCRWCWCR